MPLSSTGMTPFVDLGKTNVRTVRAGMTKKSELLVFHMAMQEV
ncbi:hypothetical protein [Wolbachia endosymbiont of Atemnus politus]|nr:hypothetical protein [Wolbachia endosymbiont of Atemnus politus]